MWTGRAERWRALHARRLQGSPARQGVCERARARARARASERESERERACEIKSTRDERERESEIESKKATDQDQGREQARSRARAKGRESARESDRASERARRERARQGKVGGNKWKGNLRTRPRIFFLLHFVKSHLWGEQGRGGGRWRCGLVVRSDGSRIARASTTR